MTKWLKSYLKIRKIFFYDISLKYRKEYKINIHDWTQNPYYVLKYKFICEVASIVSYLIFKTKITPNLITLINLLLALIAMIIFVINNEQLKFFGILIFFSKQVLDNTDGFIARKKKLVSKFGEKLDKICGHIYYYSIMISLFAHNFYLSKEITIIILGSLIILLDLTSNFYKKDQKILKKNKNSFVSRNYNFFKLFNFDGRTLKTDFVLLIILIELYFNFNYISTFLVYLFLVNKFMRNLYRFISYFYANHK